MLAALACTAAAAPRTWWFSGYPSRHVIALHGDESIGVTVAFGAVWTMEEGRRRPRLVRIDPVRDGTSPAAPAR